MSLDTPSPAEARSEARMLRQQLVEREQENTQLRQQIRFSQMVIDHLPINVFVKDTQ